MKPIRQILFSLAFCAIFMTLINPAAALAQPTNSNVTYPRGSILDLAKSYLGHELTTKDDLAAIVEPIPGAKCGKTICAAEVYINSNAIVQSGKLADLVRTPGYQASITWGKSCKIAQIASKNGLFDWKIDQTPESVLIVGVKDHLNVLGWNWYPTIYFTNTPEDLKPSDFWNELEPLINNCPGLTLPNNNPQPRFKISIRAK
jgi:hypothetical protein